MSDANARRWAAKLAALDANLLVALDALLQEGNVTRAARRVGITQSAMSQTLARLRSQFDDPILVRVGRGMEPTPFAARIQCRLHQAISELEAVVRDRPHFEPTDANRRFVIATVDYLAMTMVPRIHRALAARAPHVDLAVHALDAAAITAQLEAGVVDLYLGVRGATERGLEARHLLDDTLTVLLRPGHPLARKRLTADAYVGFPHLHVSPRREAGSLVDRALRAAGLDRRVAVEVPYFAMVPGLLARSDLIATVPTLIARLLARDHGLKTRTPPIALPEIPICMAWHPAFTRDPALVWLRALIAEVAGADGA